jgi:hypothetical protein
VRQISREQWAEVSEVVHAEVHDKHKPASWDRIDYALLVTRGQEAVGYVTVRETDHETVYWQFGGGFGWARKSVLMLMSLKALVSWQLEKSKRITMLVENTNVSMLSLAMKIGFRVIGLRVVNTHVLCEMGMTSEH